MKKMFSTPKSAGVPVSRDVHAAIARGNAARDTSDWIAAVAGYRAALEQDPSLVHIWIQLGHALKEAGDIGDAAAAYEHAHAKAPDRGEAALFLGHLAKNEGNARGAARMYMEAYRREPDHPDVLGQLHGMIERRTGLDRLSLIEAMQGLTDGGGSPEVPKTAAQSVDQLLDLLAPHLDGDLKARLNEVRTAITDKGSGGSGSEQAGTALYFDVSDLIAYFRNDRLPTGIQRVQIEVVTSALRRSDGQRVHVCSFDERDEHWGEIPAAAFLNLADLSVASGDRRDAAWIGAINRVRLALSVAEPMQFKRGAALVNLGTSWWLQNYFLLVRDAQERQGIHYIPFVHDFIPVITPEHCIRELTQDFISWALGVFSHARVFLVNSEATKRDLIKVAALLGYRVSPEAVSVIRLDADFRPKIKAPVPVERLARFRVKPGEYVLFVSTIESRKGHALALDAWAELARRHGVGKLPKLVCVGNRGWLNDAVYSRLNADPVLRDKVVMLQKIADEDLALLYGNCRFTLYPSLYEGWGLPVTESLCYGKVPVVSDSSSLPEAAGEFGAYFASGDRVALAEVLDQLIFDTAKRQELEARIAAGFKPRTWSSIAAQIGQEVERLLALGGEEEEPNSPERAVLGAFHPLTRSKATRIWANQRSGEIFRHGTGWWWPDDWGCWTKPGGGVLQIGVDPQSAPLRIHLDLRAPEAPCAWSVSVMDGAQVLHGDLPPGGRQWISFDVPAALVQSGVLTVQLVGTAEVDVTESTGGLDTRVLSLGCAGFFVCPANDIEARLAVLEAISLNYVDQLAFNREPAPEWAASVSAN
jgi:glycosyltransferase involved in cell wall biosynthesis